MSPVIPADLKVDAERPRGAGAHRDGWRSLGLALVVHGLLVAMLAVGVNWQTRPEGGLQAELFTPPTMAPPPSPPPAPEPEPVPAPVPAPPAKAAVTPTDDAPDADIAIARKRRADEEQRQEAERQEAKRQAARRKAEEERKAAEARKAEDARKAAEQKKADDARKLAEQKNKDEAKKLAETKKAEDARKAAEQKKADDVRKLAEQKKADEAKKLAEQKKQEEAKKAAAADAKTREALNRDAMKRLMAQEGGSASGSATGAPGGLPAGTGGGGVRVGATGAGTGDDAYGGRVSALIRSRTVFQPPPDFSGNPEAVFTVQVLPDCSVGAVRLKRGSGSSAWDQAAERGIQAASPLPRMRDGNCPPSLEISRRPRD